MKILITGTAGFIGFHLVRRLIKEDCQIVGLDNLNNYYSVKLKQDRLKETGIQEKEIKNNELIKSSLHKNYRFIKADLKEKPVIEKLFDDEQFDIVINLAAQAGVRYSLDHPHAYVDSNISGFLNILEGCRHTNVSHLLYASSSSVYGANDEMPFKTTDNVDHPVSLYAASKKSNELMAHTYSHLFDIPTTGLRFFTVYGPWGRPDMALFIFTKAMIEGRQIDIYNHGDMARDFTYVDDIVEGIKRLIPKAPANSENLSSAPYQLFNIGYGSPVNLMDFIHEIEKQLGVSAKKNFMDIQPGDVPETWADTSSLKNMINFSPKVPVKEGVEKFISWYKNYYRI